ncbi:conserved hypothetical protein [Paraburkholderia piptadeniae]|uniref:DUF2817 domain-containing protein n=1 Tax=Paraburkholderia piptadeniae TaxID=1701573 RepID=A0A1N7SUG5_9BURK|nr:DUF2817 domain-containing protein [Paraburkholderia piptadeniae]SIT50982.1 conserved hypothetical protein [Paraburkholderia piptadeniae]
MGFDSVYKILPEVFSQSYVEARAKFLAIAPAARPYACSSLGPSGEPLYTDVAYFGDRNASRLLILISGTHGPEGYSGSASQLLFLRAGLQDALPASTAVLLVHALNCYGFAWDRRVTAEGCDLNRNFVDYSRPTPTNPGYTELAEHLVPPDLTEDTIRRADDAISAFRKLHGELKFDEARKSGQYTHPEGVFYGGSGPTEARQTLEQIVKDFDIAGRESVIIVDYHTGLGPYGYGELQSEQPSGIAGFQRAVSVFGPSVTSPDLGTSSSVVVRGTQDELWQRILGDRHTYVALEFGTYGAERGREVIRNDHWLYRYRRDEINLELGVRIRQEAKLHYNPEANDWKEMVLCRSHQVHRQAMNALT